MNDSEGHDRTNIDLPGNQDKLLTAIKGALPANAPMIVVLMSGGPVDITTAKVPNIYFYHNANILHHFIIIIN